MGLAHQRGVAWGGLVPARGDADERLLDLLVPTPWRNNTTDAARAAGPTVACRLGSFDLSQPFRVVFAMRCLLRAGSLLNSAQRTIGNSRGVAWAGRLPAGRRRKLAGKAIRNPGQEIRRGFPPRDGCDPLRDSACRRWSRRTLRRRS